MCSVLIKERDSFYSQLHIKLEIYGVSYFLLHLPNSVCSRGNYYIFSGIPDSKIRKIDVWS